jgi:SpoVK/Ycf46/Vps4 family AAA+-type ATPase
LTIYSPDGAATWENLYDLDNLKFDLECIAGNFNGVLFVDEIEKVFGGSGTDTSGVSQDFLAQWLKFMEDNQGVKGVILAGHPGCGKSASSKGLAERAKFDCYIFDQGAMKESYVGASGANIRAAFRTVGVATNYKLLVIATCNKLEALPPEFKSRFTLGTYFVGLPSKEGRDAMWQYYSETYEVENDRTFDDEGWTGREIKACCERAKMMGKSLDVAARYVVPVTKSDPESIEKLEMLASGKFIDAAHDGIYQKQMTIREAGRKFDLN